MELWGGGVVEWWSGGVGEWWSGGVVEWWSGGVMEWWSGGVVEWWSGGVMEWWSDGKSRKQKTESRNGMATKGHKEAQRGCGEKMTTRERKEHKEKTGLSR